MTAQQQAAWTAFILSAIGLIVSAIAIRIFHDHPRERRTMTRCHDALGVLLILSAAAIITSP